MFVDYLYNGWYYLTKAVPLALVLFLIEGCPVLFRQLDLRLKVRLLVARLLWALCLALIVQVTGLGRMPWLHPDRLWAGGARRLSFSLFEEGIFSMMNVLNLLLFVPYGFLCCSAFCGPRRRMILAGFLTSLAVECAQCLFSGRYAQMDDLIMNTLGTAAGCLTHWLLHRLRGKFDVLAKPQKVY